MSWTLESFARTLVALLATLMLAAVMEAQPALSNSGFEQGSASWTLSGRFLTTFSGRANSGRGSAVFGLLGNGSPAFNATGSLSQSVKLGTVPVAVSFYTQITTLETDGRVHDTLTAEIIDSSGVVLETKVVLSNLDASTNYIRRSFALMTTGRTVRIQFRGTTDSAYSTVFRIDDVGFSPLAAFGGMVTSAKTGAAVSGATIAWGGFTTTSGPDGKYSFTRLPCQSATLTVVADRFQRFQTSYTPACGGTSVRNVALEPQPTILTGRVYDALTREVVAGVQLTRGSDKTTTAYDGSFALVITSCAAGTLTVSAPRFATFQQPSTVLCNTTNTLDIYLNPFMTHLSFAVGSGGKPVDGVELTWGGASPLSRQQSLWSFQSVACETRTLKVKAPGYKTYEAPYTPACGISNISNVELEPILTVITGTISDEWSHAPVTPVTVTFDGLSTTVSGGTFTLAGRRCVPGLLKVTAPGYRPSIERYTPTCDPLNVKALRLTSAPSRTSICGLVTDAQTGDPLAGAPMHFGAAFASSDAKGGYCLTPVACAADTLWTHVDGYGDSSERYTPACLKTNTKDVLLQPRAVSGTVFDRSATFGGKALRLPGVMASFRDRTVPTDLNGDFRIAPTCGDGKLRLSKPGYATDEQTDGFVCGWGSTGSGGSRTLNPSGTNLFVLPHRWGAATFGARVGEPTTDGFVFTDVACAPAVLTVSSPYFATARQTITPICGKSTVIYVPVQRVATDIAGRVTDGLIGLPIVGANVTFGTASTTTDAKGRYRLTLVGCQVATLTVQRAGYVTWSQPFGAACVDTNPKDVTLLK